MCKNNKCNECPFGPKGFNCNPKDEKCSFLHYISCLNQKECPNFNKMAKNTCKYSLNL